MTESGPRDLFPSRGAAEAIAAATRHAAAHLDAAEILASVGEVAYDWRIDSDELLWSGNAGEVLLIPDMAAASSGRAYAQFLEAENAQARFDIVTKSGKRDEGHGVAYQIQYRIRPDAASETRLWVEDTGRWFAGPDGRPARAQGVLRVINERYEHELQLTFLARHDGLTGELNRHHLSEVLEDTIDEALRFRSSCGFLLVGIDNLARIDELLWLRRRGSADYRGGQAAAQPDARQGYARPHFRQQIRSRVTRLHAGRHGHCRGPGAHRGSR